MAARGCSIRHLDEAKTAWTASLPIGHNPDGVHHAIRFKEGAEGLLGGRKRQVPHKDVHVGFPSRMGAHRDAVLCPGGPSTVLACDGTAHARRGAPLYYTIKRER